MGDAARGVLLFASLLSVLLGLRSVLKARLAQHEPPPSDRLEDEKPTLRRPTKRVARPLVSPQRLNKSKVWSTLCGGHPCLVLRHMSKTGGTFAQALLEQVVDKPFLRIIRDTDALTPKLRSGNFVLGTMRNPCDLQVSLAHFAPSKAFMGEWRTMGPPIRPKKEQCDRGLESGIFESWVLNSRRKTKAGPVGIQSVRFWLMYLASHKCLPIVREYAAKGPKNRESTRWQYSRASREANCTEAHLHSSLKSFRPTEVADCWMFTETYWEDLERCLRDYGSLSEILASSISWERFYAIRANTSLALSLDDRHSPERKSRQTGCSAYFQKEDFRKLEMDADVHLFSRFGYQCCGARQPRNHR
ncbi:unnamed protein product [Symbiodinium necroappetens]|uniref:Uncharacterized protein n=1 Tax=Symbiodinium necroappetens TaxID=1628268 RepID=A0A812VVI6_9DINO|nr:unnamed protein product [Symbiodinium necroappetens]